MAFSKKVIDDIKKRYKDGQTKLSISRELGVSRGTVDKFINMKKDKSKQNKSKYEQNKTMGRPLLFGSVDDLQEKIEEYFESCWDYKRDMFGGRIEDKIPLGMKNGKQQWKKNGYIMKQSKPYTVSGLAVFLKTSRETLMNYEKRDDYFDTIKDAKARIYAYVEESLFYGKPTGAIFSLKNNYGWKDKQPTILEEFNAVTIINNADEANEDIKEHKILMEHNEANIN